MKRCPIGVVGFGVVGGGVVDVLHEDGVVIADRCGLQPVVKTIVTDLATSAGRDPHGAQVSGDIQTICRDPEITTVVHAVGGTGIAKDLLLALIAAGKHVVTSNKALIAEHGDAIFAAAAAKGVAVAFEAAVAGGIPVIAALRDGLAANRIETIHAILNGTSNFILTQMEVESLDYATALKQAQALGYAEADPTLDVNGTDTAHKLAILARIAFAASVPVKVIRIEGIQAITAADIASARTMGCRIKLLAVARQQTSGLELRVAPTLVPLDHPLAAVNKNYNGIAIQGNNAGPHLLVGQGAGARPTASAVLADVIDVLSGRYQLTARQFPFFAARPTPAIVDVAEELTGSYARFAVADKPGVLAGITNLLSQHGASVLSIHQGAADAKGRATIEVSTHPMRGKSFLDAVEAIDGSGLTLSQTVCLRRM
jgi:homoserine dehydrogenase